MKTTRKIVPAHIIANCRNCPNMRRMPTVQSEDELAFLCAHKNVPGDKPAKAILIVPKEEEPKKVPFPEWCPLEDM